MKKRRISWRVRIVAMLVVVLAGTIVGTSFLRKELREPIHASYSVADPAFRETAGHLFGFSLTEGNAIRELLNGDEIFPAMLDAIRGATNTITLETYIWSSGELSDRFIEAFAERVEAGVKVHLIVDGVGALKLTPKDRSRLSEAGVEWVKYGRRRWYDVRLNVNHRTHRKLMVVDGRIGFIGGVCIADSWLGDATDPDSWRDTHFIVEGPVAKQLQAIFAENWLETTRKLLEGPEYFPEIEASGTLLAQGFKSGPREGQELARIAYLMSIAAAQKNIRLSHAYFVPDDLAVQMLMDARKRGVEVEVIVPGRIDSRIGKAAARSRWEKLAGAGVKFYEYQPALYHCKVMIVDDVWVTAGSINFDERSFRINDEANINVLDADFAAAQVRVFEADKLQSREMTPADLQERGWPRRAVDKAAGLIRFQL
jgi:cardiolipin synthase A/B